MRNTLPSRVRLGAFEVDLRAGELRNGENTIWLQDQPLFVLRMLVESAGELVTREEVKQKLWPNDTVVDFDNGINATVRRLRQALGDAADEPKYVATIARRGYRLLVPVERVSDDANYDSSDSGTGTQVPTKGKAATLIGKKVSHYRVLNIIGGGGMGLVYEAEDLKLGRRVALKFLPEELASQPVALQRFEREARAASSLDHPSICTIYEVEEHEGQPFIVMQLLHGETLRDRLAALAAEQKRLSLGQLLHIADQICLGLEAAHDKGIIHRDIKPANIFLTTSGQVKILDFGLAKLDSAIPETGSDGLLLEECGTAIAAQCARTVEPDPTLTRLGVAMGTAGYMSPEQVRGEKLDARTDVFSFGLVLYEMATGQRAFSANMAETVQDAILNDTPVPVHQRNATAPSKLEQIIERTIEKDRQRRYQTPAEIGADLQFLAGRFKEVEGKQSSFRGRWTPTAAIILVALVAGGIYWYRPSHDVPKLTEQDTVVLGEFDNKTGDQVFDDSLKQGLFTQLDQSPFLTVVSVQRVNQILEEMKRQLGEPLTLDVAREVCRRTASKALVTGAIRKSSNHYLIGLRAIDCDSGTTIAEVQASASDKQLVIKALSTTTVELRSKLGESLASINNYSTPLEEATTPSLEALRAYSLGWKAKLASGNAAALPLFRRAVELDPHFAMAYAAMANSSDGQYAEDAAKAYALRDNVSLRERFYIETSYYVDAIGDLEKAKPVFMLWQGTYPRDIVPYVNLGYIDYLLGDVEETLEEARKAVGLGLGRWQAYLNLVSSYEMLNRLDEAEAVYDQAQKLKGGANLLDERYVIAFLKDDQQQMSEAAASAMGKPGMEDTLLGDQANTEAWYGRVRSARELSARAALSAQHDDKKENAAVHEAMEAMSEAEFGNARMAHAAANRALTLTPARNIQGLAALAIARAGDTTEAEALADKFDRQFPMDTVVHKYWLPTIRAAVALRGRDPGKAVDQLQVARAVELGGGEGRLLPAYIRGQAYLTLGDAKSARREFQKFVDHYGLVGNLPWGALARLGLARAYALEAQSDPTYHEQARTAYQNFLTLWKGADPDIPIYRQAKAEYARLQ